MKALEGIRQIVRFTRAFGVVFAVKYKLGRAQAGRDYIEDKDEEWRAYTECPYAWAECAYCKVHQDFLDEETAEIRTVYECLGECDNPDYCPCSDAI